MGLLRLVKDTCIFLSATILIAVFLGNSAFAKKKYDRVAVVILTYEQSVVSYVGEQVFEDFAEDVLLRRYDDVFSLSATEISKENIKDRMRRALNTGKAVDLYVSSHSTGTTIRLGAVDERVEFAKLLAEVVTDENKDQLNIMFNFGCENYSAAPEYLALGFKTYIGHKGESMGAWAMQEFLKHWVGDCRALRTSISLTNEKLKEDAEDPVVAVVFSFLAEKPTYKAELIGYGRNQRLCGRWRWYDLVGVPL